MDNETVVAVYDTVAHADLAIADLKEAGIADSAVSRHASDAGDGTHAGAAYMPAERQGFWSRLFGGEPDHDTTVYDRSVQSGGTVVTVRVADMDVERVMDILDSHNPVDMEERASSYGLTQGSGTAIGDAAPLAGATGSYAAAVDSTDEAETMRLSEERLAVGKRVVNRGGTRVRRFVTEMEVAEQVRLREEHVTLERRPVAEGTVATGADFTEKTIEMTEMAEEAVVAKTAVVTEEVRLRKQATERVETVRDTLRKEEVEIEQIPAGVEQHAGSLGAGVVAEPELSGLGTTLPGGTLGGGTLPGAGGFGVERVEDGSQRLGTDTLQTGTSGAGLSSRT